MSKPKKTRHSIAMVETASPIPQEDDITLTAQEENILRMHLGLPKSDHAPLPTYHVHPKAMDEIRRIEAEALHVVLGLRPLTVKEAIIRRLNGKS